MSVVIQVPYHLDEYLPDLDFPLPPDAVITADLPAGDVWGRLGRCIHPWRPRWRTRPGAAAARWWFPVIARRRWAR